MRRALIVGIDHYDENPLATCVRDAGGIARLLENHESGENNFDVRLLVSDESNIGRRILIDAIKTLFAGPADLVLLYFAGHCALDDATQSAALVTPDMELEAQGVTLADIMSLANRAGDAIRSIVIVLDCCQAGAAGELQGFDVSVLGDGVTILASADRNGVAASNDQHGVFSELVIAGLEGAAADVRGIVTPAAIYALVDQSLGAWDQRPVYKANVQQFVALRGCEPKVPDAVLKRLPDWFPQPNDEFALDPTFEPEAKPEEYEPVEPEIRRSRIETFESLQLMNRHSLVEPVGTKHMYHAAMERRACRLTRLGRHYWRLAESGKLYRW